ncbi:MAG TPA: hypothetical protein VFE94_00975 [Candidatus Paceibacterota bacterium]|nr:hypothetical protein [Candidatus Paceibacterota bacterium]
MKTFITDAQLQKLLSEVGLSQETKQSLLVKIPHMNDFARMELVDLFLNLELLNQEKETVKKWVRQFEKTGKA